MQDSARSAPRNIAEGFGRYCHANSRSNLRVANGSLMETSNHLRDGYDRGYFKGRNRTTADSGAESVSRSDAAASLSSNGSAERAEPSAANCQTQKRRTVEPKNPEPKNR